MYGVAWVIVAAVLTIGGVILVAGLTVASPLFGVLALAIVAVGALVFYTGQRGRIGTERARSAKGQTGDGAPAAGEGSRPSGAEDFEPTL